MNKQFGLPSRLILGTLLMAGFIAPPHAVPQTQDTSNASLADTMTWLTSFLATATGAKSNTGESESTNLQANGCNVTLLYHFSLGGETTVTFSLSDIDPAVVARNDDVFADVVMQTRGSAPVVKEVINSSKVDQSAVVTVGFFADLPSAQRVASAFQHAANLCANASPF